MTSSGRAPIRVLHLRDSPWVDGPGRTILETACHVDKRRVEFHIGALVPSHLKEHPLVDAARERGVSVIQLQDPGGLGGEMIDRILSFIDEHQINVIHSSEFRTRLIAHRCRMKRPVRLVTTAHGWIANTSKRRFIRFLDKGMLRLSDAVVMVSRATRQKVPAWWVPESRTHTLHNALVLSRYGRDIVERPRRRVDPAGRVVLLNVGRLSPEKGQDMLIRAVHKLSGKWPGLLLRIAGVGPLESSLRELAVSLGIPDRVEFVGYVADMPPLYYDCDMVVQSSYTEGLPNVILEAAYLRVPILATAVGGTDEVVEHGRTAWLIRPDFDDLVAGLERFLNDPKSFERMAELAHVDAATNYSFDARTTRMTAIYERVLSAN